MSKTEEYTDVILNDYRKKIVKETPTIYESDKIERLYEFADGAVVKYEWQSFPAKNSKEIYNHRFTLITPPKPNPGKIKTGVIKTIDYSGDSRR